MEQTIPTFMQYGAMGVLALAFMVQLIMNVRSDKRAQKYADRLDETSFDRSQLIQVVVENTKTSAALVNQITEQIKCNERTAEVIEKIDRRMDKE